MQTLLIIVLLVAFISGAPLFTVMLGGAALGALSLANAQRSFDAEFDGAILSMFGVGTGEQASVLSTLPLFIFAGYLLAESKSGDRLVRFGNAVLGWMPGGLAIVAICTSALYTVFTGGSGVTIIALGGVLLPGLVKQGYPEKFSLGLIAGTGAVGLLFPPAVPLFIFGTIYGLTNLDPENWNSERFMFAGIAPGMLVLVMLSAVAVFVAVRRKLPTQKFSGKEFAQSFLAAAPELVIPFAVIVAIAKGFALSEVAALTVSYVIILEVFIVRQLRLVQLWTIAREAMAMVGAIFIIIFASTVMTNYLTTAKVPTALVEWTRAHVHSKWVFLLALNGILLLVGTIMDVFSAIVIVVPLIAPIAKAFGVDPYHLGIIFLLNLEVGYLHPPVGLNLFITSVKFQKPVVEVMWATMPFLGTMLASLLVITYVPAITIVPEPARRGTTNNFVTMVHDTAESVRSVKEVALVGNDGTALLTRAGQPAKRTLADCVALTNEGEREKCKGLFFDVTNCRTDATPQTCANTAIAAWVDENLENLDIQLVDTINLVDAEGKPVTDPKTGQSTKALAGCQGLTGMAKDACIEPFLQVSRCRFNTPSGQTAAECETERVSAWVSDNLTNEE